MQQLFRILYLPLQTVVVEMLFLRWEKKLLTGERCKVLLKSTTETMQVQSLSNNGARFAGSVTYYLRPCGCGCGKGGGQTKEKRKGKGGKTGRKEST